MVWCGSHEHKHKRTLFIYVCDLWQASVIFFVDKFGKKRTMLAQLSARVRVRRQDRSGDGGGGGGYLYG